MSRNDAVIRMTRRLFGAGTLAAVAAAPAGRLRGQQAVSAEATVLADYAHAADPATRLESVAAGEHAGGRFRTFRLVSQAWRGTEWTHELSLFLPRDVAPDTDTMLLWIDGGAEKHMRALGSAPSDSLKALAVAASAAGLPGAVVRQVPYQPMFDGLYEDDLIAHTFVEYARTGDPSWPLLLPMVKAAVGAMTAAQTVARDEWGLDVEGFMVTGASKRGWTTWLTAAVDDRVRGVMPMVIDMLSIDRHFALQRESFGGLSDKLVPYTKRDIERLMASPRGRELIGIIDPYAYRERLVQPKVIVLGTNDPYWPLEALDLYASGLAGRQWVSYQPNGGHGLSQMRIGGLAAAFGRHVAGRQQLPACDSTRLPGAAGMEVRLTSDEAPAEVLFWQATSPTRDFRRARWTSSRVEPGSDGWRGVVGRPATGFAAGLLECRYPRNPLPLMLTTRVAVVAAT